MENFLPPKIVLGTIIATSNNSRTEYYVGEASISIEQIGNNKILNIWANSFHYEKHNNIKVLVSDIGIEIMQPIKEELLEGELIRLEFPRDLNNLQDNWGELYYGHFYQFSHLQITNWIINISTIGSGGLTRVEVKGYITDDIRQFSEDYYVECTIETRIESRINSRWNWNYSLDNPNSIIKR